MTWFSYSVVKVRAYYPGGRPLFLASVALPCLRRCIYSVVVYTPSPSYIILGSDGTAINGQSPRRC
jgi:hypothetical protein